MAIFSRLSGAILRSDVYAGDLAALFRPQRRTHRTIKEVGSIWLRIWCESIEDRIPAIQGIVSTPSSAEDDLDEVSAEAGHGGEVELVV